MIHFDSYFWNGLKPPTNWCYVRISPKGFSEILWNGGVVELKPKQQKDLWEIVIFKFHGLKTLGENTQKRE